MRKFIKKTLDTMKPDVKITSHIQKGLIVMATFITLEQHILIDAHKAYMLTRERLGGANRLRAKLNAVSPKGQRHGSHLVSMVMRDLNRARKTFLDQALVVVIEAQNTRHAMRHDIIDIVGVAA